MNTKYWTPISLPLPHLMKPLLVPFHTLYSCEFGVMRVWEHMPMMAGMVCIFLDFMQRRPYLTSLTWLLYLTSSSFRSSARAFENTCQWWLVWSIFSFIFCSGCHTSHRWCDFCIGHPRRFALPNKISRTHANDDWCGSLFSLILCSDGHTSHRWRDFWIRHPRRRTSRRRTSVRHYFFALFSHCT